MTTSGAALNLEANSLALLFLMATRLSALLITTPVFGARVVPAMAKIGFAFVLAFVLLPTTREIAIPLTLGHTAVAIGKELLVGLMSGMAVTLVFAALQIAAAIAGVQIGFGFSSTVDTTFAGQSSVLDQLFSGLATLIFLSANLHHPFLMGVRGLFDAIPVGTLALSRLSVEGLVALSADMFLASLRIAFPLMGALLLTDVFMAVISRTAPQMNIFFVGLPIKIAVGILAIIVLLPFLAAHVENLFQGIAQDMAIIMRYR